MATIFKNLAGTLNDSFKIGKGGTTVFQGIGTPVGVDGDFWLNSPNLKTKVAGTWENIHFDNLKLVGNQLLATNVNGDVILSPNGTGEVILGIPGGGTSALTAPDDQDAVIEAGSGTGSNDGADLYLRGGVPLGAGAEGDVIIDQGRLFVNGVQVTGIGGVDWEITGPEVIHADRYTDTIYTHPATHPWSMINGRPTTLAGYGITDAAPSSHLGGNIHIDWSVTGVEDIHADRYTDTIYTHPATHPWSMITSTPTTLAGYGITDAAPSSHLGGNQHIDWTADQGVTNIHTGNYVNTTYINSDWDHDQLTNFVANEHIDWSVTGVEDIHADRLPATASEINDLTVAVTWANVPDANITQSSVTQHESALSIDYSQVTGTPGSGDFVDLTSIQSIAGAKTFTDAALSHVSSTTPIFTVKTSAASSQDSIFRLGGARTASSTSDIAKIEFMNIGNSRAEIVMRDPAASSDANDGSLIFRTYDNAIASDILSLGANKYATFAADILSSSLGANTTPAADGLRLGGYGIMGNRGSMYITNAHATGVLVFGNNGVHNANNLMTLGPSGLNVVGPVTTPSLISATGEISLVQNTMTATKGALSCSTNFHIDSRDDTSKIYLNYYGGTGGVVIGNGASGATGALQAGAITATSFGGITSANLLDKSATESISGLWTFTHADGLFVENAVRSGYISGTHTTAFGATIWGMGQVYTGSDYGDSYTATNVYGVSYLRAAHPLATGFGGVGEGIYTLVNGVVQAGMGATGIKTDGTLTAVGALSASNFSGSSSGTNTGDQVSSDFNHDSLTGFVSNEHIDWTADAGGSNISHANIPTFPDIFGNNSGNIHFFVNDGGGNLGMRWNASTGASNTLVEAGQAFEIEIANDTAGGDFVINRSSQATTTAGAAITWTNALVIDGATGNTTIGGTIGATNLSGTNTGDEPTFAGSTAGLVPTSAGGTTNFLRADGSWAAAGSSGVTSITAGSGLAGGTITTTGTISIDTTQTAMTSWYNTSCRIGYNTSNFMDFNLSDFDIYFDGIVDFRFNDGGIFEAEDNIIAYSGSFTSDRREKYNIVPIDHALERLATMNGYFYNMKKDGRSKAGIIAQEAEIAMPCTVGERAPLNDRDGTPMLNLDYNGITGLLVQGINELNAELIKAKQEIKELKEKYNDSSN